MHLNDKRTEACIHTPLSSHNSPSAHSTLSLGSLQVELAGPTAHDRVYAHTLTMRISTCKRVQHLTPHVIMFCAGGQTGQRGARRGSC